ncbi:hypothetical protein ACIKP7_22895 [Pseudomonas caricapapayae]|uniref:Uncharacterized protein n=1 Tax=Pseudomonas caricapapayae TaxID=46678 RepID=A0ACC7M136_9PSED
MRKGLTIVGMAVFLGLSGCAQPVKPISEVKFYPKPTKDEAMEKINGFLKTHLLDPYSAHVECSDVSNEAWVWPGIGYDRNYGYLVICQVNAKNKLGGYVGSKRYVFRLNGPEFAYEDVVPKMGLMTK